MTPYHILSPHAVKDFVFYVLLKFYFIRELAQGFPLVTSLKNVFFIFLKVITLYFYVLLKVYFKRMYVCIYVYIYVCVCVCVCVFICRCHRLQQRPLSRSATQSSRGEGRAGSQPWIVSGSCRSSVCPRTRGQKMPRGGSRGYPQQTTLN